MVRRLRIEKLPENVSVSPSRGSCRRNAHSRLSAGLQWGSGQQRQRALLSPRSPHLHLHRRCPEQEGPWNSLSGQDPPAVAVQRGRGPGRQWVEPLPPVAPPSARQASSLEGLSPSATLCSSMISGQRLFKLRMTPRLQRPRRRIVGAVVPFQCVPVSFHAHTHTQRQNKIVTRYYEIPRYLTALQGCPPMQYALVLANRLSYRANGV